MKLVGRFRSLDMKLTSSLRDAIPGHVLCELLVGLVLLGALSSSEGT